MNKKKELKKGVDSHNFMDKILTKLKMTKHGGEEKVNGTVNGKKLKKSDSSSSEKEYKTLLSWENTKVTSENIMELSDQLQQILEYVQSLKDVDFCTYDYPNKLNEKLQEEAIELRNLFRDIRAAAIDIERLKKQRYLVKKEKCLAMKKLDKLREDEIKEMESIICIYAKPLHSKWESIKNTQKIDVLENFMNEVTGKHRAIEILQELVRRKLSKFSKKPPATPFIIKKNISSTNMNNKIKNQDKTTTNWNIPQFSDIEKFGQNFDKVMRGITDRDILKVNRRKRQKELREERGRQNTDVATTAEHSGGLELQLVPIDNFTNEDVDDVVSTTKRMPGTVAHLSTRTPPIINIDLTSDDDSVSRSSSDFAIESFIQGGSAEINPNLQHEMRNVLQALFGEIRHIPQLSSFTRHRHNNNNGNDLRSSRTASH